MGESGVTETLARFACCWATGPHAGEPGGSATTGATATALADTVAVAVAGGATPAVRALVAWLDGEEPAPGPAAHWGAARTRATSQAALLNGTAAHALDWDDASPLLPMHAGAVLFPALLAQAARRPGASGHDLVAAYAVGNAAFRAVAEILPDAVHYGRGWHTTSTVGRLAAVAAVARLAGLGIPQTRHALGIAASMAAGALANFGTMTKPLHAGLAARDAVTACALAERGFTASPVQLEHPKGFLALYGAPGGQAGGEPARVLAERLDYWASHWPRDWGVKQYPSCYATHRAIDAARWLRSAAGLAGTGGTGQAEAAAQVAEVQVTVHSGGLRPLLGHLPGTGLEGKFSLPYTVAAALAGGTVRLADFTDEAVAAAPLRAIMSRVTVTESDAVPGALVTLGLRDGRRLTRAVDIARGDARDPLGPAEIAAKAREALGAAGWTGAEADALTAGLAAAVRAPRLDHLQGLLRGPQATEEGKTRR